MTNLPKNNIEVQVLLKQSSERGNLMKIWTTNLLLLTSKISAEKMSNRKHYVQEKKEI